MSILKKSMLIEPHDNVAVAVEPIEAGEATMVGGEEIVANQFIKEGHKIARTDIAKGDEIIKYGVHIGVATQDIKRATGSTRTTCMMTSRRSTRSSGPITVPWHPMRWIIPIRAFIPRRSFISPRPLWATKRADGSFGIRNQVLVISLVQCSNNAAQRISNACNVPGHFCGRRLRRVP